MPDTSEQAQLRVHLAEMRHAARAVGRDFRIEFDRADEKIDRMARMGSKEAKYALMDIRDDFTNLSRAIDDEARKLPHQVGSAVSRAGAAAGDAASRFASATSSAFESAGSKAVEGTRNAAARVAGVRRTPMKEWHTPTNDPDSP
ncbi:MAG: hypothetical protein L3K16_03135 [Thermoplasmata archaeon]|nr:hypothetical protein [Thermoplasmata archaeon]